MSIKYSHFDDYDDDDYEYDRKNKGKNRKRERKMKAALKTKNIDSYLDLEDDY